MPLPFETVVYATGQVPIPARIARELGLEPWDYADVTIEFNGMRVRLGRVRLVRTHAFSRRFTIPKEVRDFYGIKPFTSVRVVEVRPTP
mgnify:CR=1 FL=1